MYLQSKKDKKRDSKAKQENRFNNEKSTGLNNFNGTIVKGTLIWVLVYLIYNGAYKIKGSRLQQKKLG